MKMNIGPRSRVVLLYPFNAGNECKKRVRIRMKFISMHMIMLAFTEMHFNFRVCYFLERLKDSYFLFYFDFTIGLEGFAMKIFKPCWGL